MRLRTGMPLIGRRPRRLRPVARRIEAAAGASPRVDPRPEDGADQELRRHNEYLSALHETSLALMNRLEPAELLEAIVSRAAEIVGTEHGWVYLVDRDEARLGFAVGIGLCAQLVGTSVERDEGVAGRVWRTGEPLIVDDYTGWGRRLPFIPKEVGPVVGVPLRSGTEVVGVIGLARTERGFGFSDHEVKLLGGFAELASIALDNARLYQAATAEQQRSRQLADAALEGICIHENGVILEVNRAFTEMFGYQAKELVGRSLLELVDPELHAITLEQLGDGDRGPIQTQALRKNGSRFHVEAIVRSLIRGGRSLGVAAVRDVTERKRAEEEAHLLQTITSAMAVAEDFHQTLRVAIREICETTGWVLGEAWVPAADGDGLERVAEWSTGDPKLEPFSRAGVGLRLSPGAGLAGRVFAEGRSLWFRDVGALADFARSSLALRAGLRAATGVPVLAGDEIVAVLAFFVFERRPEDLRFGKVVAAVGAQIGAMARRRRAEEAVRAAEERYRGLFEHAAEGIFRMSRGGAFESVNPSLARTLGYESPEEVLLEAPRDRYVFADDTYRRVFHKGLEDDGSVTGLDCEVRRRGGDRLWASISARAVRDESGAIVAVEGTLLDLTHRREGEERLRAAYEREREAAERLRALDEMKNSFLTAVSHELRTPLASILGFALTLTRDDIDLPAEQVREMLERIAANSRKLERMLGDLLDLDRITRGILHVSRRVSDVGGLARGVVEEMELDGRPVLVEAEPVLAEVDAPKVERILENLLANAVKYTPAGTPIWVRVAAQDEGVLAVVEDAGPGVPDHLREVIFEPFRQGDGAPDHAPGTGIGLSLVARFAELHGGRAWVEDRPGGGASFRVYLPGKAPLGEAQEDQSGVAAAHDAS